jgi:hypothetical protein
MIFINGIMEELNTILDMLKLAEQSLILLKQKDEMNSMVEQ